MRLIWENLLYGIKIILIALLIVLPIRYFLIQPFYVKGASMEPSFANNEYLIAEEISYYFHTPERGDIVVFQDPISPANYLVKRIIGLPGEIVDIRQGRVYIANSAYPQGALLQEPYLDQVAATYDDSPQPVILGKHEYFMLGDNRRLSMDSRYFGPIPRQMILGRVFVRGWPLNKAGFISTPDYDLGVGLEGLVFGGSVAPAINFSLSCFSPL